MLALRAEGSQGRWYLNVCVKVKKQSLLHPATDAKVDAVGIDLSMKELLTTSEGELVPAQRFYRDLEPALAVAQRAGRKHRVKVIHASADTPSLAMSRRLGSSMPGCVRSYRPKTWGRNCPAGALSAP